MTAWYDNNITGNYTPSVGMYDTSIGLDVGTPITSPVNGVIIGGNYAPNGLYGAYGQQLWGGEIDILTNLVGYGQMVVVDILHFDTIAPNIIPGTRVMAGEYLGTSGGQTSGGHWPSQSRFSTGPHIGVGVRNAFGFLPAWDAAPLISRLRAGTVQSSMPTGYGSSGPSLPGSGIAGGIGQGIGTAIGQLFRGWNPASGLGGDLARIVGALEQDITGFSIRVGGIALGVLLIILGIAIFFFSSPQARESVQESTGVPIAEPPQPSQNAPAGPQQGAQSTEEEGAGGAGEGAEAAATVA